ncbi:DNA repair protein RecN [Chryseomicrobium sp. FSL W7-1435]|uniref:DNA repair protein RecN n=1 Tax=Chryseomicrobium sp. FSL W7-1435 TaxID=2921704 RepID=UPI00315ACFE9
MLAELSIRNFAIIDELTVSFSEGLTVLTGETGAGKSIIIDAVQLLCGARGSSEFIRHGTKKAELEGLFSLESRNHSSYKKLEQLGIPADEESIILRRELNSNGKSTCRINGKLVTIAVLREVGTTLVDIHGQHESQELMDERFHIDLLDQFASKELIAAKLAYKEIYASYLKTKKRLKALQMDDQEMTHRMDLYRFQLNEIQEAGLTSGEEEQLTAERTEMMNYSKIVDKLQTSSQALTSESGAMDYLGVVLHALQDIRSVNQTYEKINEEFANAYFILEDIQSQIQQQLDSMEFDEERMQYLDDRLALIQTLKRKYGQTVDEVILYGEKINKQLDQLTNRDEEIAQLEKKSAQIEADLLLEAQELTAIRQQTALALSASIMEQLSALYMDRAIMDVRVEEIAQFGENGRDHVVFYIATNVGEPLKPLTKVASGGELSRVMLALKSIFSKHQEITSIIFDEVDTGVSGRVAQAIAEKIGQIAKDSQVLVITHLPAVAALADTHLRIEKHVQQDRTKTSIQELTLPERTEELSRMMAGEEISEITLHHAAELLQQAQSKK